jgi:MFS family permease
MFGYRIFSVYFPLFLVANNFSTPQIGYAHFLIYLPIAFFAPLVGFLNHRINPAILMALGIFGYGIYSLGMIIFPNHLVFYLFQVILGISAALFFVSSRAILMGSKPESPDRAFAWFYSAPSFGDAVSPAVGALLIWKFGFVGVFALGFVLHLFNAIFCFIRLRKQTHPTEPVKIQESGQNYLKTIEVLRKREIYPFVLISFLVLILAGFNNAFFVLFLKSIGLSFNQILVFNSVLSLVFVPISLWIIKRIARLKSERNISLGSQIAGMFSILLGGFAGVLNFFSVFFIMIGQYVGGLMAGSGRSGLLTAKLKEHPKEASALDTIFAPLATSIGALVGGLIILPLGYPLIFIIFGALIFGAGTIKIKTHVRN